MLLDHAKKPTTALLFAGPLSSLVYAVVDQLSATRYPGYSLVHQAISELSAMGAPASSAELWRMMGPAYGTLFFVFTIAVLQVGRQNQRLRRSGWAMLAFVAWNLLWPFFPMHARTAEKSFTDVMHLIVGAGSLLLMLSFIGLGARALGARFRAYSWVSFGVVAATGIGTLMYIRPMSAGEPTPWLGVVERVMIYGYLLWVAVLAVLLVRANLSRIRASRSIVDIRVHVRPPARCP